MLSKGSHHTKQARCCHAEPWIIRRGFKSMFCVSAPQSQNYSLNTVYFSWWRASMKASSFSWISLTFSMEIKRDKHIYFSKAAHIRENPYHKIIYKTSLAIWGKGRKSSSLNLLWSMSKWVRRATSSHFGKWRRRNAWQTDPFGKLLNRAMNSYTEQGLCAYPQTCFTASLDTLKLYWKTIRLFLGIGGNGGVCCNPARGRLDVSGISLGCTGRPYYLTTNKTVPHLKNDLLNYKVEGEVSRKVGKLPQEDAHISHISKHQEIKAKKTGKYF